jgi:hypothetical protein
MHMLTVRECNSASPISIVALLLPTLEGEQVVSVGHGNLCSTRAVKEVPRQPTRHLPVWSETRTCDYPLVTRDIYNSS